MGAHDAQPAISSCEPDDGYQETKASYWLLIAMTVLATGRSLVHILAEDGGANSIAGVAWVVITRYRFLVPFALLIQLTDWVMRSVVGELKPLIVDDTPPGGVGNLIFPPLLAIALWFALPRTSNSTPDPNQAMATRQASQTIPERTPKRATSSS